MRYRKYTKRHLSGGRGFFSNLSVTNWLIMINFVLYILLMISFPPVPEVIEGETFLVFHPFVRENIALSAVNVMGGRVWTFLSSMFMHGGFAHLFVNMISLMFIGNFVERIIGRKRFFWFYMLSGIVAGLFFVVLSLIFQADLNIGAVGASGAIFGLGGLLMILTPDLPVLLFFFIPMKMRTAMLVLLFGLWIVSIAANLPIGNTAHLGGLLVGVVFGLYLKKKYKRKVAALNRMFA